MIALDIETSGIDFDKCGIWQIGAVDLDNPENIFLEESRIDGEDFVLNDPNVKKTVFEVIGKTEKQLRDENKQSQKELLHSFFNWVIKINAKNCLCQNPQFDLSFIFSKARKYALNIPLHHRAFDLHSVAQIKYLELHNKLLIKDKISDMNLTNILNFCGMKDNRGIHNALEDAKLTAECFSRLAYGKILFSAFKEFKIPEYLLK